MSADSPGLAVQPSRHVLHWVQTIDASVCRFLGPATTILAQEGVSQTLIAFDDDECRRYLPQLDETVRLHLVPGEASFRRRWSHSLHAVQELAADEQVGALHVHGILPIIAGASIESVRNGTLPLYYSPHGYSPYGNLILGLVQRIGDTLFDLQKLMSGGLGEHVIASSAGDVDNLKSTTTGLVNLVESPVDDCFLDVVPNKARHPLIVMGSPVPDQRGSEVITQLAVLLRDQHLRIGFNWIGATDSRTAQRLRAASVQVYDAATASERAQRLAAGWVYLSAGGSRELTAYLVEAMAVGLPCVALDTDEHRELIRHGDTGFLYSRDEEALHCIATLLDSAPLRQKLGNAARQEARERFSSESFRRSLLAAYSLN